MSLFTTHIIRFPLFTFVPINLLISPVVTVLDDLKRSIGEQGKMNGYFGELKLGPCTDKSSDKTVIKTFFSGKGQIDQDILKTQCSKSTTYKLSPT